MNARFMIAFFIALILTPALLYVMYLLIELIHFVFACVVDLEIARECRWK